VSRAFLIPAVVIIAVACGLGSFELGRENAPTATDASIKQASARQEAFDKAFSSAHQIARHDGEKAGRAAGTRAGHLAGERMGRSDGSSEAGAELAAAQAAAEAAERARNCGAPLFVEGYCPTDEEIAQENRAEAICGGSVGGC
jgi:hypothetical protein